MVALLSLLLLLFVSGPLERVSWSLFKMLTGGHWPGARRDVPDRRGFCSWEILLAWLIKIRPPQRSRGDTRPAGWPLLEPCSLWSGRVLVCGFFVWFGLLVFLVFSLAWGVPSSQGWFRHPIHAATPSSMENWGPFIFLFFLFLFPRRFFFLEDCRYVVWTTIP